MPTSDALDELIFSLVHTRWQKLAMIIAKALSRVDEHSSVNDDAIARRIVELVEEGRLEGQGDLSKWRNSEVRVHPTPINGVS